MAEESTTPDLVEATRQFVQAWSSGDVDLAVSFYAPDAVMDSTQMGMFVYEGHPAIREALKAFVDPYEEFKVTLEEVSDLGNGVLFAIAVSVGRLLGSGGEVQMRGGAVVEWADGLITRTRQYTDIDEARAAAERLAEARR